MTAFSATTPELVVLVDDDGRAIGTHPKADVHTADTPLHRAFSCYLFDRDGRVLVTRRAVDKTTFPGLWTNSVCGHPAPGEPDPVAIARRAQDELGLSVGSARTVLPDFRYRAEFAGVVENEICPVYAVAFDGVPTPNPAEVAEFRVLTWAAFRDWVATEPDRFSPWCRWQLEQLAADPPRFS